MDSPTVPGPIFFSPKPGEDNGHSRSSSAPGQYGRLNTSKWTPSLSALSPSSPLNTYTTDLTSIINGLGLTFEEPPLPSGKPPSEQEHLSLSINPLDDKPPPPPPKSPPKRHRRKMSEEPAVYLPTSETPGQSTGIDHVRSEGGLLSAPSVAPAGVGESASHFPSRTETRIREVADRIVNGQDKNGQVQGLLNSSPGNTAKDILPATTYEGDEARKQRAQAKTPTQHIVHQHSRLHSDRRFNRSKDSIEVPPPTPRKDFRTKVGTKDVDIPKPLTINRSASRSRSRDATRDRSGSLSQYDAMKGGSSCGTESAEIATRAQTPTPVLTDIVEQPDDDSKAIDTYELTGFCTGQALIGKTLTAAKLANPVGTLKELSKQSEALHVRYKDLRLERQKISSGLLANLKDERPGPEYANVLLDQQLSLAAVTSAMNVCFARLKALDCRKEEAINALIGKHAHPPNNLKPKTSIRVSKPSDSGRATPDLAGRKLGRFGSQLHKERGRGDSRQPVHYPARTHSIRREVAVVDPSRSESPISSYGREHQTKEAVSRRMLTPSTQSPRIGRSNSPRLDGPQRRPSRLQTKPVSGPPSRPLPSPPPSRAGSHDPQHRSALSSVSSSSENEIKTPTEEDSAPKLSSDSRERDESRERKPSIVQAIEVVIDDDLLDLYNGYAA